MLGMCYNIIFFNLDVVFKDKSYSYKNNVYYFIYMPCAIILALFIIIVSILNFKFSFKKKDEKLTISITKYVIINSSYIFILIQPLSIILKILCEKYNYKNVLIYYLFFTSLILIYYSYNENKYQNNDELEHLINYFLCNIYSWICICLLFGHIFNNKNMIIPLFIGIVLLMIAFKFRPIAILKMRNDIYFQSDLELFNQLRILINVVIGQDIRENNLNLLSYFFTYIKNSINKYDFDKLNDRSHDEIKFLFFQYIENTFRVYNHIFKDSICLKIMNAFFLMKCLAHYNKAYMLFYSLLEENNNDLTYSQEFFIYRQKKYLENKIFEDGVDLTMISTYFQINSFIKLISNISELYLKFWSILLQMNENEDKTQLLETGFEICENREDIEFLFNNLRKSYIKDKKIFLLYNYYLKEILNEDEAVLEYFKNYNIDNFQEIMKVKNILDLAKMSNTEFQYIIISGRKDSFGIVEKLSLGLCGIFGYTIDKIIGHSIDLFIPTFLQNDHELLLKKLVKDHFKDYNIKLLRKDTYMDMFYHNVTFIKTSSKYLFPVPFIIGVTLDENFDSIIYGRLDEFSQFDSNEFLKHTCHIITDTNLIIQESTPNNITFFENNNFNCKNIDITSIIKEIQVDFATESIKYPKTKKLDIKKIILKTNYMTSEPINIVTVGQKKYKMNCKELLINNKICGYHFNFQTINKGIELVPLNSSMVESISNKEKRKLSFTQLSIINKEILDLNNEFIPEGNQFYFNIEKRTYYPKKKINTIEPFVDNNVSNYFKRKFIDKKKSVTIKKSVLIDSDSSKFESKNENENFSSDYTNSDYEDEETESINEESSENYNIKIKKKKDMNLNNILKINELDKRKSQIKEEEITYYKIKNHNILFFMYDFAKNVSVEIKLSNFKSQVDEILSTEKNKSKNYSSKESIKRKKTEILNIENCKEIVKNKKDYSDSLYILDLINDKINPKIINKSILINLLLSIFSLLIILTLAFIYCYQTYLEHNNLCELTKILIEFSHLSIDAYNIIYISTELFLVTNEKYNGYEVDKNFYCEFLINSLQLFYNQSYEKIQMLKNNNVKLSKKNQELINSFTLKIYSLNDDYMINQSYTKLPYLINEYFVNVYEIIYLPIKKRIFCNKYYGFILYNTDNGFSAGVNNISDIYRDDFYLTKNYLKFVGIIYLSFFTFVNLVICFIQIYVYKFISNEKDFKMKYFFKMTKEQISNCFKKCENFQMLSLNNLNEPSNLLKNPYINLDIANANINESESSKLMDENLTFFHLKESINEQSKTFNLKKQNVKKRKLVFKKQQLYFIIIIFILIGILLFMALYSDEIYLMGYNYLLIHYSIIQHEIFILKRFAYLRVYIIFEYYIESYTELKNRIIILFNFIHDGYLENSYYIKTIHNYIKQYGLPKKSKKLIENTRYQNICNYFTDLEKFYNKNCVTFLDGILLKGYEPLTIYLVETFIYYIRDINQSYEKAKIKNYTYNEYLYGSYKYNLILPNDEETLKDYQDNNPFNIFNDVRMINLILIINAVYIPLMKDIYFSLSEDILKSFDFLRILIIVLSIGLFIITLALFFIFILPHLITKNIEINKIRKMLEIIPKDIIYEFFVNENKKKNDE